MRNLATLLCLLVLACACGNGHTLPAAPSTVVSPGSSGPPPAPPPTSTSTPRVIGVGEEVKGTLTAHGTEMLFELTALSDGTLVARLGWDPGQGRLEMGLGDSIFANFPDNWSPIVGKLPVTAGQKYRLRVADGAPWDYDELFLPFVLSTSIQ